MARKRGGNPDSYSQVIGLAVIVAVCAGGWYAWHRQAAKPDAIRIEPSSSPVEIPAVRIDPANEGRTVRVTGDIRMDKVAQDPQLGVRSDSAVLWRNVEMLQWAERCTENRCGYTLDWSREHVDSSGFREEGGHVNPDRFPFTSETFMGERVRLGAFVIDSAAVPDQAGSVLYPIRSEQLPENLAVTFRIKRGILFAATNAEHPTAGDVRVTYRVLPLGQQQSWTGIQKGDRLTSSKH